MKKKILVIGNSKTIKNLIYLLFKGKMSIHYLSFRKAWNSKINKKYEIIILTGFHFKICYLNMRQLKNYTKEYNNFISEIRKKCKELILITTYLNIEYSFCRVVYFYYNLIKKNKLLKYKNIKIYNFKKIVPFFSLSNKYVKNFLQFCNFEIIDNVANNFNNYRNKKLKLIKFYFMNIPRNRFIDRILRIL